MMMSAEEVQRLKHEFTMKGLEIRAGIDTETVRGLQLINGGMAAGLVTLLPAELRTPIMPRSGYTWS